MTTHLRGAKAVFFDLDDTIYDFAQSMRFAFEDLHARFPERFARHTVDAIEESYWAFYEGTDEPTKRDLIHRDPDLFRRTMWAGALAGLGFEEDEAFVRTLTNAFEKARPEQWRRAMYPGAKELLSELRPRTALGLITNGPSRVQRPKLEAIGYRGFFEEARTFVSGEFGAYKPDPSIFLAAAKAAGVGPHECVMVGDAREYDMPAKGVGFRTILFTGPRDVPDLSGDAYPPDAVARSYHELRALLL